MHNVSGAILKVLQSLHVHAILAIYTGRLVALSALILALHCRLITFALFITSNWLVQCSSLDSRLDSSFIPTRQPSLHHTAYKDFLGPYS